MPAAIPAIVAIGAYAAGAITVAQLVATLVASALSAIMSFALKTKPDKPTISNRRQQLLTTVRDPATARELIVGKTRKGGPMHFFESVDNETVLLMGICLAGHEVEAIDEIYNFDDVMVSQAGEVQGKYRGLVEFEKFLGTDTQPASTILLNNFPGYTANDRLLGIAHIVLKFQFNRDVFNGYPNITAKIRGAKYFDPRDSQTRYGTNAALAFAHYVNHSIYGLPASYDIDMDNTRLIASANECDEDVAIKAGKTLEFDGVDDVIDLGNVLNQTGALTIEARVRPAVVDKPIQRILDKDSGSAGFSLGIVDDKVQFVTQGLSNVVLETAPGHITAATWKSIAGRWDPVASTKTIFVNGAPVAQISGVTGSLVTSPASLRIGNSGFSGQGLHGRPQDIRLWSEARTDTEIAAFHDKTLVGNESDLEGYWKLDEKRGDQAEDATERPTDGLITGAVWVDDDAVIGSQKRYTANGVIFSDQSPGEIMEDLLTAMAGTAVFSGGKWLIRAAAYEPPTVELGEDDAFGPIVIQPKLSGRDLFNAVRGIFISPENQYQSTDFPIITNAGFEAQDGGLRRVEDIELPFTNSVSAAERLGWLHLLRNREQVQCQFPAKLKALRLIGGGTCMLTDPDAGWSSKPFEVLDLEVSPVQSSQNGSEAAPPALGVNLKLRETNPIIYDFNPATDEVPLNPSPDSNLPSPFGNIALISDFVDRTGFEDISSPEQAGWWPGTITGFVPNPLTGHLNVEDQIGAAGDNFDVFDEYVQTPVKKASYESPEIDIEFNDIVRTYIESAFFRGAGEMGRIDITRLYDFRSGATGESFKNWADIWGPIWDDVWALESESQYGGYQKIAKSVKAEGRYFKHKIEVHFIEGAGGYLAAFTPNVDKMTLYQRGAGEVIPTGGKTVTFPFRYHNIPAMSYAVNGAGIRFVTFPSITKVDFNSVMFDQNTDDVGGTMDWESAGV